MKIKNRFFKFPFALILLTTFSCAHLPGPVSPEQTELINSGIFHHINYSLSNDDLLKKIDRTKLILRKKQLSETDLSALEDAVLYYQGIQSLKNLKLRLPPKSETRAELASFCLSPNSSIPSENEPYIWSNQTPNLDIKYGAVIERASKSTVDTQSIFQEVLWNLKNKVRYENYPKDSRKIIDSIDLQAKYKLPSKMKDIATEAARKFLIGDGLDKIEFKNDWSLIEGKYYSYRNVLSSLEKRASSKQREEQLIFPIPSAPELFTKNKSLGFSNQLATIYNPSESYREQDLKNHILYSKKESTQQIGIYVYSDHYASIERTLHNSLGEAIVRNSVYWYGGRISPAEAELIKQYPLEALSVYIQSEKTRISVTKYFVLDSEDDESDAFRHFIWAGLVTQSLNELFAWQFLEAHESNELQSADFRLRKSREMDLFNDHAGIEVAKMLQSQDKLTWSNLEKEGIKFLREGKLKILKPSQQIKSPNPDGKK